MMGEPFADLARWAIEVVYSFGYFGVFVVVALANLHLPVPTELTLPLSGFLIGQGRFSFVSVLVWSTAGGVAGALAHYLPGFWIGEESLRRFVRRVERFKLLSESDLDKASEAFERHGGKAIVIGHLVPGVGSLISVPAGIKRMPILGRFMVYTILGSALWNIIFNKSRMGARQAVEACGAVRVDHRISGIGRHGRSDPLVRVAPVEGAPSTETLR